MSRRLPELEQAIADAPDAAARAHARIALAEHLDVTSRSAEAVEVARAAEADARSAGDAEAVAWAILRQGIAHSNDGASAAALDRLRDAHLAFTALGDDLGRTRALARIAADLIDAGRPEDGIDALVEATILFDHLTEPSTALADALSTASDAHAALGSFPIARELNERVLALAARLESDYEMAWHRYGAAVDFWRWGETLLATAPDEATARLREAVAHAHEAIRHADLAGEPSIRGLAELTGALALIGLGDHGQAAALLDAATRHGADAEPAEASYAALGRARIAAAAGDVTHAIEQYGHAIPSLITSAGRRLGTDALRERAELRAASGDLPGAVDDLRQAADHAEAQRDAATRRLMTDVESRVRLARVEADVRRHHAAASEAERLLQVDALTQVGSRRHLEEEGAALLLAAHEGGEPCALAVVDIDRFKRVNDRHSHVTGDAVLRRVAAVLVAAGRRRDRVYRYAGDEFVIVLPGADGADAVAVCERLAGRVREEPWDEVAPGLEIRISIGVASVPVGAGAELWSLFAAADRALLAAKRAGRGRVALAS